jgi:hypothetical protein
MCFYSSCFLNITKNKIKFGLGITDEIILVNLNVFEKYYWLSVPVLSLEAVFKSTMARA